MSFRIINIDEIHAGDVALYDHEGQKTTSVGVVERETDIYREDGKVSMVRLLDKNDVFRTGSEVYTCVNRKSILYIGRKNIKESKIIKIEEIY